MKAVRFLHKKRDFDRKISKGRVKVENAFGLLKNRWQILRDLNVDLAFAPTVIGACCFLHNFVQIRGETEPHDQRDPHPNSQKPLPNDGGNPVDREMALRIRAALFRHSNLRVQNAAVPGLDDDSESSFGVCGLSHVLHGCSFCHVACFMAAMRSTSIYVLLQGFYYGYQAFSFMVANEEQCRTFPYRIRGNDPF
ncbi:hypothetical protein GOP47_0021019 [Adiantum capillus-veneris]|uniref:DDE Tnp4 domain-containing protein n=1 Tax=Adiantum capillus-veneris TaxID=13818 RepID=A0A9D4UBW0_ADICA|nr:hypothetical protein GOP47_0021019 [Adiantum capillus-veneris]